MLYKAVVDESRKIASKYRFRDDVAKLDKKEEEMFKNAIIDLRLLSYATQSAINVAKDSVEKFRNEKIHVVEVVERGDVTIYGVYAGSRKAVYSASVVKMGENTFIVPGVTPSKIVEATGGRVLTPAEFILAISKAGESYPFNVVNYPIYVNGRLANIYVEGKTLVVEGERIPVEKVVLKEFEEVAINDTLNRYIHEVPYLKLIGSEELNYDITTPQTVEKLYDLFKEFVRGNVQKEVDVKVVYRRRKTQTTKCYSTDGYTILCRYLNVMNRFQTAYLDISTNFNENEVVGVIINAYYRKVVSRQKIQDGLKGWIILEKNGEVIARPSSVVVRDYERVED